MCFRNQREYVRGHQFSKYFDMRRDTVVLKELFSTVCLGSMYRVQICSQNFSWGRGVPTLRLYVTYVYVYKSCYKIYDIYICRFHDSLN